jgi:hypothetical protein
VVNSTIADPNLYSYQLNVSYQSFK